MNRLRVLAKRKSKAVVSRSDTNKRRILRCNSTFPHYVSCCCSLLADSILSCSENKPSPTLITCQLKSNSSPPPA